jgi:RecB family exonuclease
MTSARSLHSSLGDHEQPAPGVLVATATRIRDFQTCPRRYWLRWVIGVAAPEDDLVTDLAPSEIGLAVHAELHERHAQSLARHGDPGFVAGDADVGDERVLDAVLAHGPMCPDVSGATYLGGEIDLRWFHPRKALLVTGRVDALWEWPDGTIEIRDYKTGLCADDLRADLPAGIYGALGAAAYPGRPVRVSYERLGSSEPAVITLDVPDQLIRDVVERLDSYAVSVRQEATFAPTPSAAACGQCVYRSTCPVVAASPPARG